MKVISGKHEEETGVRALRSKLPHVSKRFDSERLDLKKCGTGACHGHACPPDVRLLDVMMVISAILGRGTSGNGKMYIIILYREHRLLDSILDVAAPSAFG